MRNRAVALSRCLVRSSKTGALVSLLIFSVLLLIDHHFRLSVMGAGRKCPTNEVHGDDVRAERQTVTSQERPLLIVERGQNIKVGETTEVHVMSAIRRGDYPVPGAFNVLLVSWANNFHNKHNNHSFLCCLSSSPYFTKVLQIPAKKLFSDDRLKVPMKYTLFACTFENQTFHSSMTSSGSEFGELRYMAFAETSCQDNMTAAARPIADTEKARGGNFAICVKIAYGELDHRNLVEWFELAKIVGVSVVQVFYHIVSENVMSVFRYYEKTGFVILSPVTPAVLKGHPPRGFTRPRWEAQAWMDGTVICNDCLHRLSQFDFVAVMDFDELLLPSPPFNTLPEVMQNATKRLPNAGCFFIETYIVLLDWPEADNKSSISFMRHLDRSNSNKLDNFGTGKSSPKVICRPQRSTFIATHDAYVKAGYSKEKLPIDTHKFLHYRRCKEKLWGNCQQMEKVRDNTVARFKPQLLQAMSRLPLRALGCGNQYAASIAKEAKGHSNVTL